MMIRSIHEKVDHHLLISRRSMKKSLVAMVSAFCEPWVFRRFQRPTLPANSAVGVATQARIFVGEWRMIFFKFPTADEIAFSWMNVGAVLRTAIKMEWWFAANPLWSPLGERLPPSQVHFHTSDSCRGAAPPRMKILRIPRLKKAAGYHANRTLTCFSGEI